MKDAYEILRLKEAELARVRKEIDSLNIVARLLLNDGTSDNAIPKSGEATPSSLSDTISRLSDSASTNVDSMFSSIEASRSGFWESLKRAR